MFLSSLKCIKNVIKLTPTASPAFCIDERTECKLYLLTLHRTEIQVCIIDPLLIWHSQCTVHRRSCVVVVGHTVKCVSRVLHGLTLFLCSSEGGVEQSDSCELGSSHRCGCAVQFFTPLFFSGFHSYSGFRTPRQTAAAEFKETGDSYFKYDKRQPLSLSLFPDAFCLGLFDSIAMFNQSRSE